MQVTQIFTDLNQSGIRYFHFKSNEHLKASFEGKTDFDLFVHKNDCHKFEKLLINIGFKRRISTFDKFYYGMHDYLYYDASTEMIIHFHVHYELLFGEKYSKNHYFFNSELWLNNTVFHHEFPIRVVRPEFEIILLTIRYILKFSLKHEFKNFLKKIIQRSSNPNKYIIREYHYLLGKIDENTLVQLMDEHYPELKSTVFALKRLFESNKMYPFAMLRLKKALKKTLEKFQRLDDRTDKKLKKLRITSRRFSSSSLSGNGRIISLIGADGAGKTSMSNEIVTWLNYKLSAEYIYLGRLKKSYMKNLFIVFSKAMKKLGLSKLSLKAKEYSYLENAKYRYSQLVKAAQATQRGILCITDRYPLKEFWDMKYPMDGPRIPENSTLYKKEYNIYNSMPDYPDIIIVLKAPLDVSIKRKPNLKNNEKEIERIQKKIDAIYNITNTPHTFFIDASSEYSVVKREIKKIIWDHI